MIRTPWFGFEQEYFFWQDGAPLGFPKDGFPPPQGPYYTGVGYKNVGDIARKLVEEHIDLCIAAGINIEGINAEVAKGQWEFQIFGKGSKTAADQMWVARYIMTRLCEPYGIDIEWQCKPVRGPFNQPLDWNGSGMHTNFSSKYLREVGGKEGILRENSWRHFAKNVDQHIAVYGPDNHLASHGTPRDPVDRQVQLRFVRSRRVRAYAGQFRQGRLQGLPRGSPSELGGRPVH